MEYEPAGNLSRDEQDLSYEYDFENRLTRVYRDLPGFPTSGAYDPGEPRFAEFTYDALGRRIEWRDFSADPLGAGLPTRYYYDDRNVVAEFDGADNLLRYYVHGANYVDEHVLVHDAAEDKDYYHRLKELDTVAGLVNEHGIPVEAYTYDAYGAVRLFDVGFYGDHDHDGDLDAADEQVLQQQCTSGSGNPYPPAPSRCFVFDFDEDGDVDEADAGQFASYATGPDAISAGPMYAKPLPDGRSRLGNPYFFTGRRLDTLDDGQGLIRPLYHYRARAYDPRHGRFMQRDPLEYLDGMNLYEYARSRPTVLADPGGRGVEGPNIRGPEELFKKEELPNYLRRGTRHADEWLNRSRRLFLLLDPEKRQIVEPVTRQFYTQLAQLVSLSIGFSPGGPGPVSKTNRFVYTCKSGWVDIGHFFFSALGAYALGAETSTQVGLRVERNQEFVRRITNRIGLKEGWGRSAYTIEDLPSNALGVKLGARIRSTTPLLNQQFSDLRKLTAQLEDATWLSRQSLRVSQGLLAEAIEFQTKAPFDIHEYMTRFFKEHGAVGDLDLPVPGSTDIRRRRRILEEHVDSLHEEYPGPGTRNFSPTPTFIRCHHLLCNQDGTPR